MDLRSLILRPAVDLAYWLQVRGHRSASAAVYTWLANGQSDAANALYYRARALEQAGEMEAALEVTRALLQQVPDFVGAHFDHGLLLQRLNRDREAVEAFDLALQLDPALAACHADKGYSLLRLGDLSDAEASLRRALRHDDRRAEVWHNLGIVLSALDRPDEAIDCYRAVLRLGPDPSASLNLADLLEREGRLGGAEMVVREAQGHDPDDLALATMLVTVLREQGRTDEAKVLLDDLNAHSPDDLGVLAALVECHADNGAHDAALETAEHLCRIHPGTHAQMILAWTYLESNRPARAVEICEAALAAAPEDFILRDALEGQRAEAVAASQRGDGT